VTEIVAIGAQVAVYPALTVAQSMQYSITMKAQNGNRVIRVKKITVQQYNALVAAGYIVCFVS